MRNPHQRMVITLLIAAGLCACEGEPVVMQPGPDMTPGGEDGTDCKGPALREDLSRCMHAPTDYEPRQSMSMNDLWPACISDDNVFHQIGSGVPSSVARVMAFSSMGRRLWMNPVAPTPMDFVSARNDFTIPQGLGSRVERRQDIHYPELPESDRLRCGEAAIFPMYPDRCAGPARLLPIVNDAFQKGIGGMEPRVQAARIEAALLWFLYLSTLSEVWTCSFSSTNDCDSMWAYYNGAEARDKVMGLSEYVRDLSVETHDRIFDGMLAARCWRDLDRDLPATKLDLYRRALGQLDRALTRGMALVLRERLGRLACATGQIQKAHLAFVNVLGGFLDRAARAVDPARADLLKAEVTADAAGKVDVMKAQELIDALFPCP